MAATLRQVDVVEAGAGGDDEPKRRQAAEHGGGDRSVGGADHGFHGSCVGGEELVGGNREFPCLEEFEFP